MLEGEGAEVRDMVGVTVPNPSPHSNPDHHRALSIICFRNFSRALVLDYSNGLHCGVCIGSVLGLGDQCDSVPPGLGETV